MENKESFLSYLEIEKRYSPHTVRSYANDLVQFYSFLLKYKGTCVTAGINSGEIRAWVVSMLENDYSPVSVHRKISCLRVFFKYLRKQGIVTDDPLEKIVLPKRKKTLPSFVSEKSLSVLLDEYNFGDGFAEMRDRTIIEMLYATGVRRAELINLKTPDVDLAAGTIKVTGKRNKQRIVPVVNSLISRLEKYILIRDKNLNSGKEWFFVTDKGNKLYDKYVYNIVNRYLSMVTTIEKKSPHVLRHTFATHMLNRGADLNSIKELLGHANLSATQIYTHNTFEKLKKIHKLSHPRG